MPYHYSPKNMNRMPSKMKQNLVNKSTLHASQKRAMMKHMNHHTIKHGEMMIKLMKQGHTFKESHKKTTMKIGK